MGNQPELPKIYCANCEYANRPQQCCDYPIDDYYSPTSPCKEILNKKNHDNKCKDFMKKGE